MHKEHELFSKYNKKKSMLKDIIILKDNNDDLVGLNKKIKILFLDDNLIEEFILVGDIISKDDNTITVNSPLGSVIYGKKVGDKVKYNVDDISYNIQILNIINN